MAQVVTTTQCQPSFPGGDKALMMFIQKHINYPDSAREHETCGKVIIGFKIDTTGKIDSIHVIKGIDPYLDKEALRVIHLFPSFIPCKSKDKDGILPYYYVLPIVFRLS